MKTDVRLGGQQGTGQGRLEAGGWLSGLSRWAVMTVALCCRHNSGEQKLRDTSQHIPPEDPHLFPGKGTLPPPSLPPEMDTPNNACQINDQVNGRVTRVGKAASLKEDRTEGPSSITSTLPVVIEEQPPSLELS